MPPRGSEVGIVSVGSCDGAIREAMDLLRARGVGVDYMRVRAFPFGEEVERFLAAHQVIFVVEQNRDAQLRALLTLETAVEKSKLHSLLHYNGLPISSSFIVEGVLEHLQPGAKSRTAAAHVGVAMTFIAKPKIAHPSLPRNPLGMTRRDYEGALSTLCAGCGHDSITAAIVEACWELAIEPQNLVKLSGIGCSSKTTAYFVSGATASIPSTAACPRSPWAPTPPIAICITSASQATAIRLSIGLGQFCHAIRRNLNMLYIIENNGVYGLTKGQFSASADVGSKAKKGETNFQPPIDPVLLALTLGATFVARSFSGDKAQLVPLIQAGLKHKGFRAH